MVLRKKKKSQQATTSFHFFDSRLQCDLSQALWRKTGGAFSGHPSFKWRLNKNKCNVQTWWGFTDKVGEGGMAPPTLSPWHTFVLKCESLCPRFQTVIITSSWLNGTYSFKFSWINFTLWTFDFANKVHSVHLVITKLLYNNANMIIDKCLSPVFIRPAPKRSVCVRTCWDVVCYQRQQVAV